MTAQNLSKGDKLILPFMNDLKLVKDKMGFNEYMSQMIAYFERQNSSQFIQEMLADPETGEISRETIKEVLEDSLGRDIPLSELKAILEELHKEGKHLARLPKETL
jgi:hypothetical protein